MGYHNCVTLIGRANTRRLAVFLIAAKIGLCLQAQNLLPNASFEYLTWPAGIHSCQLGLPDGHVLSDWYKVNTSDFIHTDYPVSRRGDLQTAPYNGKGMMGLYMNDPIRSGVSEYIFAKLSDTLRAGCTYRFTSSIRFKSLHLHGIDKLEIKLLNSDACERYLPDVSGKIHVVHIDKKKASENEWMLLNLEFESDADYSWLAVGNFSHTGNYFKTNKKAAFHGAYIYIDEVALTGTAGCPEYKVPIQPGVALQKAPQPFAAHSDFSSPLNYVISFEHHSDSIAKDFEPLLNLVLKQFHPEKAHLHIIGHTDASENESDGFLLGMKRAESVGNYFIAKGIPISRIRTFSKGKTNPLAPRSDEFSAGMNRRVEIVIIQD